MKEITKYLLTFIKKEFGSHFILENNQIPQKFIQNILSELQIANDAWKKENIKHIDISSAPLPKGDSFAHISEEVRTVIETRKKMGKAIKNNLPSTVFKKGQIGCTAGKELPKGKDSRHWKGGKIKQSRGYICVYSPTHPHCQKGRCSGYVYEHRLVMEKHIGRYLEQGEVVHHINRITNDNRIENLILFKNQSEHRKHHGIENKKH